MMTRNPAKPTASSAPPRGGDDEDTVHFIGSKQPAQAPLGFNMTPMIDIVFNMLVFFVVCSTFVQPEGWLKTRLPRDQGLSAGSVVPITPIKVRLSPGPGEECYINIDNYPQGIPTFETLYVILQQMKADAGEQDVPVVLIALGDVKWQHVVDAYNQAVRAKFGNIQFGST